MKYINLFFLLSVLAPMAVRANGASNIGDTVVPFQRIYEAVQKQPQLYDTDFVFLLGERVADKNYTLEKVAQACIDYAAYNNAVTKDICKEFVATAFGPSAATESTDGVILTTFGMPADEAIEITIHAAGQFNVDCGNGKVHPIDNTEIEDKDIVCTYPTGGTHKIKITGHATNYPEYGTVIDFSGNDYLQSVQGSLGAIFPTLENGKYPNFASAFEGCTSLTTIPGDLFSGVTGAVPNMFDGTFANCTKLMTIPTGLFAGVNGAAEEMFYETFYGCTSLMTIPKDLFSGVTEAAEEMFYGTFYECENLKEIPAGLFSNVRGAAENMFASTFESCTNLATIHGDLFDGVTEAAEEMFYGTFYGCENLEKIPDGLFSNVTGAAVRMFASTFDSCTNLTTIPEDLFDGVKGGAVRMFDSTFEGCTKLTKIPDGLFDGVTDAADNMFHDTFAFCSALTEIPADLFNNVNGTADGMFDGTFYDVSPDAVPEAVNDKIAEYH